MRILVSIVFAYALLATSTSPAQDELVQLVLTLLEDEDKEVRALAFEQIRTDAPGAEATKVFADQLPQLPVDAQVGLLSALADRGDPAARPQVVTQLDNSDSESVRAAAIEALGKLGDAAEIPRLLPLLTTASDRERSAVRQSLIHLSGDAVSPALAARIAATSPAQGVAIIEILTRRRAVDTIPELLAAAQGPDAVIRSAAMQALGELASPNDVAGMVGGVLKAAAGSERAAAEKAVMFVCQRSEDDENRAAPVLAAMESLTPTQRREMYSTVGRIGGAAARTVVERAIADTDQAVRDAGIQALCNWPDSSVESRLLQLARTAKTPQHRKMALRALIRVAPLADERDDQHRLDVLRTAHVMCESSAEKRFVLQRASAIRTVDSLRFLTPFIDQPEFRENACEAIVELAHHRDLREPNKPEFDKVLDKILSVSTDATTRDRAQRYKKDQTWVRPK